jgi:hypothetical protein
VRKIRKQSQKEEELVGLLTDSIQMYGYGDYRKRATCIIPTDELKVVVKRIAAGSSGAVFEGRT